MEDDLAFASHPLVARDLLAEVRRLEDAREMIARQREPCALAGEAFTCRTRDRVTLGAQLLRIVTDLDALVERGMPAREAVCRLEAVPEEYDVDLLGAVRGAIEARAAVPCAPVAA